MELVVEVHQFPLLQFLYVSLHCGLGSVLPEMGLFVAEGVIPHMP